MSNPIVYLVELGNETDRYSEKQIIAFMREQKVIPKEDQKSHEESSFLLFRKHYDLSVELKPHREYLENLAKRLGFSLG